MSKRKSYILYVCTAVCFWVTRENSMSSVERSTTHNVQTR